MTKKELAQFEKDNRRINFLLSKEIKSNMQHCLKCGRLYDSGHNKEHFQAGYYCGLCLIESIYNAPK